MSKLNATRRQFLRTASVVGGSVGTAATPLALNLATLGSAAAQSNPGDYKAIVCIFLYGGNDANNMVLRTDADSYNEYFRVRNSGTDPIALLAPGTPVNNGAARASPARLGGVLPLTPASLAATNMGKTFGVHPSMPETQALFNARRLAVMSNAGPLVVPMTGTEFRNNTKPRPMALGSHNDQQSTWQALGPEGAKIGWGGRLGDLVASGNSNTTFTSLSVSGNNVFSAGQNTYQYQVGGGGSTSIAGISGTLFGSMTASTTLRSILTSDNSHLFAKEYSSIAKRSIEAQATFQTAFNASQALAPSAVNLPSNGQNVGNGLAQQLQTIARVIAMRGAIGAKRQIFMASMGGFDTHDGQNMNQADLLARLSHALGYFDAALANVGGQDLRSSVTTFTASDFSRTNNTNGDGTDHAWGASSFVMGGAVRGGQLYGNFPTFGVNNANEEVVGNNWLPNMSVDTIGATMGRWFGASEANLDLIFPNLKNFPRDAGFMVV